MFYRLQGLPDPRRPFQGPPRESWPLFSRAGGLLVVLALVFTTGLLASYWLSGRLVNWLERQLARLPLLGAIYAIIKDTVNSFGINKKGFGQLVRVRLPGGMTFLGFLTNESDPVFLAQDQVAVYYMQSMQWAGNLVMVPRAWIEPVDVSSEDAIKFIASAGLLKGKTQSESPFQL
jgi:uncharacterized membrane protein